jgi:peroxiredoxin
MALLYTPAGEPGSKCPPFELPSVDGGTYALKDFAGAKALVVMFICNHCPYVQAIEQRLLDLAHALGPRGAAFVGICANDPTDYPEDAPEALLARWREKSYGFPYLIDESQEVARAFGAVCTPDIFVYDSNQTLRYRGRLDDSWKNPAAVKRQELKEALEKIMQNLPAPSTQNPSMGCSIKWKKG